MRRGFLVDVNRIRVLAVALSAIGLTCIGGSPETPSSLMGTTKGCIDVPYSFAALANDPDGDSIRCQFDWGDGTMEWTGYRVSGAPESTTHAWSTRGAFSVRVRAQDLSGRTSGWSATLPVAIVGFPNRVVATIPICANPCGVAALPNSRYVYVTDVYTDSVFVIRTSDNSVAAAIQFPEGRYTTSAMGIAVLPNGEYVYVGCYASGCVKVIRTSDNTIVATIPIGFGLWGVAALPDGSGVYVTCPTIDGIFPIRTSDDSLLHGIWPPYRREPMGIVATIVHGAPYLYVANEGTDDVSIIRVLGNLFIRSIPVGGRGTPFGACDLAALSDGSRIYVANADYGHSIAVISTQADTVVDMIPFVNGSTSIAVLPGDDYVYVACPTDKSVSVIRTLDDTVVARIPVDDATGSVAVLPDGQSVYVANRDSHTVNVIGY